MARSASVSRRFGPLHRAAVRTSSDASLSRTVFSPPQETRRTFRRKIPLIRCARSYRTLRDGSSGGRCPRHCVPGYDHAVPPGHLPVAITPPYAHGTAPISYQTVFYTWGARLFGHAFQEFVSGCDRCRFWSMSLMRTVTSLNVVGSNLQPLVERDFRV